MVPIKYKNNSDLMLKKLPEPETRNSTKASHESGLGRTRRGVVGKDQKEKKQ